MLGRLVYRFYKKNAAWWMDEGSEGDLNAVRGRVLIPYCTIRGAAANFPSNFDLISVVAAAQNFF